MKGSLGKAFRSLPLSPSDGREPPPFPLPRRGEPEEKREVKKEVKGEVKEEVKGGVKHLVLDNSHKKVKGKE